MTTATFAAAPLGVGIVGLSASGGWAAGAHVPALAAVDGLELRALATSSPATAGPAAEKYGVAAFDGVEALAGSDEVDLVVVSVKAPRHYQLVLAALPAGKPVLCEWPLARNLAEAEQLTEAASGVRSFVGLQGRSAPAVRYLRELVVEGYLGEVLSTTLVVAAPPWGATITTAIEYLLDRDQGATMLAIPFGHAIDSLAFVLGEFAQVKATTAIRRPEVLNTDTGRPVTKTAHDQLAVTGVLTSGAVAAVHVRGGDTRGTTFQWEISGTEGDLLVTAPSGSLQFGDVVIRGGRGDEPLAELTVPATYDLFPALSGHPANPVAHAYRQIIHDLADDTAVAPDFAHALRLHRLLDTIERAAATATP